MVKVSIIMPVYNAAEFLAEAIDSVLGQSLSELELIAVNDGSKDNSRDILEAYAGRDKRVVVLDQDNSGPSAARNNALRIAKGEFVFFLDSDDFLEGTALEHLYNRALEQQADLVIAKYDIYNGLSYVPVHNLNRIAALDTIDPHDTAILWTFSLWNKLFRRALIQDHNMTFPPVSYSEDGVFTMNFVYQTAKITGLNEVILHYRRVTDAAVASITATVSKQKILDYLEAHRMIWELIEQEEVPASYRYMFLYKEINILFTQFYRKFWSIEEEAVGFLASEIRGLLERLDINNFLRLQAMHGEISFEDIPSNYAAARKHMKVAAALYGETERAEEFITVLRDLEAQSFVYLQICVPEHMRSLVEAEGCSRQNLIYLECSDKEAFEKQVKSRKDTPYYLLAAAGYRYETEAIRQQYLEASCKGFALVEDYQHIHGDRGSKVPFTLYSRQGKGKKGMIKAPSGKKSKLHSLWSKYRPYNIRMKFPIAKLLPVLRRLPVLHRNYDFTYQPPYDIFCKLQLCYGCYTARKITVDHDSVFLKIFPLKKSQTVIRSGEGQVFCLKNAKTDPAEVRSKLLGNPKKEKGLQRKLLQLMGKLPVQNKILFYSIRTDGKLDGNIQAVYEHTQGRKVVCARRLPHDQKWKLRMYYEFATSKVIVVDDYARYLRLFPLKKSQRVVQLWHACGAFKKFGADGTNLTPGLEISTHAQYNLVSVSAEGIRDIYAKAFQIDADKVAALGVPRTDLYFDRQQIQEKREDIYQRYPQLQGKRIYLYAPTFRDQGADRSVFEPKIDFEDMHKRLPENSLFIIAPHPIMKEAILKNAYDNILEIRDISTGDLMFVSDLLVTDYSSVIFEYSLLQKPIIFYCYDKELYDRGFYLDYDKDLPGEIFTEYEAFMEYLMDPTKQVITGQYKAFVDKYMSACDGSSAKRIADVINEYIKEKA